MRLLTYTGIADDIEARILTDPPDYPPGSALPTMRALAERYGVHQTTIAKAITVLKERDLVYGHQGRAVFVVDAEELEHVRRWRANKTRRGGTGPTDAPQP